MSIIKGLIKKSDYVSVQWNKVWYKKESKNVCVDMELSPRYGVKVKKAICKIVCELCYHSLLWSGKESKYMVCTHTCLHTHVCLCMH